MRYQSSEAINNFSFFVNQVKSEYVEQKKMTLEKKLSVIKRCMAEIEFSKNVEMECKLSKSINDNELLNLNNGEIEIGNLEVLNKAKLNKSTNEFNISKSSILSSLSLFSETENKISKKDNSKRSEKKIKNSVSIDKFLGSLFISSTDESTRIYFRLK